MRWGVILGAALAAMLPFVTPAFPQATVRPCVTTGTNSCPPISASNPMPISGSITPSGTQAVNLTQILGAAVSVTNPVFVSPATGATFTVTGAGGTFPVTIASGGVASGAVASGAYASGAFAAGAFASGSYASGSQPVGITPTDRTVTSATGASQTVMSGNASRKSLTLVNTGNANCGVNPTGGTAAIGGAGTITILPAGAYTPRVPTLAAVTAICTAGQPLYADEG